jgi:uncharacterized repeat protein (TIGR03803 family)
MKPCGKGATQLALVAAPPRCATRLAPRPGESHIFDVRQPGGIEPYGTLIMDKEGNLYGTTCGGGLYSDGTVFEVAS